jgi:hypothetical protein
MVRAHPDLPGGKASNTQNQKNKHFFRVCIVSDDEEEYGIRFFELLREIPRHPVLSEVEVSG